VASRDIRPIEIPDDFVVWAGTDLHGQLRAVDTLLVAAGLTDTAGRWTAPPRTAFVVCGDVVDKGPDSLGLARRLADLRSQAADAGGIVALLEGNHEVQVLGGLEGEPNIWRAFMSFGGGATLASVGLEPDGLGPDAWSADVGRRVAELAPDFLPLLWSFAPYARWRDVLFVHGGPIPGAASLETFERQAERLWIRERFFSSPHPFPDAPVWATYRDAGIRRVVFGHTAMAAPTFGHDGRVLNLDTWRGGRVTIARMDHGPTLLDVEMHSAATEPRIGASGASMSPDEIHAFDTALPAIADAWMDSRGTTKGRMDR